MSGEGDMGGMRGMVTRMPRDKGYDHKHTDAETMGSFVCPRANSYGGRDGVIPPGLAIVRGLKPVRMRKISVADTGRSSMEAREGGKTESDSYMGYYTSPEREEAAGSKEEPESAPPPANPKKPAGGKAPRQDKGRKGVKEAASPKKPDRMFSGPGAGAGDDDTLDGFYDGLSGSGFGTEDTSEWVKQRGSSEAAVAARRAVESGQAGLDLGAGDSETVVAEVERTGEGLEVRRMEPARGETADSVAVRMLLDRNRALQEEVDRLRNGSGSSKSGQPASSDDFAELESTVLKQRDQIEALRKENEELKEAAASSGVTRHDTVRVVLSKEEEKIRIGGKYWSCNIMGSLHFSRDGSEVVLVTSDAGYSSDLAGTIQNGKVAIVTGSGRTYCTYAGNFAKIYGESDTMEYVAMFRFSCDLE